ncbi:MAG: lipoyl synthase [Planctomycetes bacterium]|nr:lipoyl synthase [Planctomycetota bacterium]
MTEQVAKPPRRLPTWIRTRVPGGEGYARLKGLLREKRLATVCEEAHCPNVHECWGGGTATVMLLGDTCTRGCRFCAVKTAKRPPAPDPDEPLHLAETVSELGLTYVVLTMVDRDDLGDGGAGHVATAVRELKRRQPSLLVECLVSDFQGDAAAVETILDAGPDVFAHNVETVERLTTQVRDARCSYRQSLEVLRLAKDAAVRRGLKALTKSSIMLGLGETTDDLRATFADLRAAGVDVLTLGQYLRPSAWHLEVVEFITPERFEALGDLARTYGFEYVASGPLVRSSYRAGELFLEKRLRGHEPPRS